MKGKRADVAIVGGGLIGCALARELAGRGASVTVIEKTHPGAEASSAAAGLLAPQAEGLDAGPFLDLALESRDLYPHWVEQLFEETQMDVGYRRAGILRCAFPGGEPALEVYEWQWEAGLPVERRDAGGIAALTAGAVSGAVREALFFPEDALVDNRRLTEAVRIAAERRGVTFLAPMAARRFAVAGGRCGGVETEEGLVEAGHVVNAAGAWASFDPRFPVPVEPVRGQIVEVESRGLKLAAVVESEEVYIVPRGDSLLLGSTTERVGFIKGITVGAVRRLLAAATRLLPPLEEAGFRRAWSGLRPGTPDGWPLLGPSSLPGLSLATGHFRNGILLAPVTALALADELSGRSTRDFSPFSALRFAERPAPAPIPEMTC